MYAHIFIAQWGTADAEIKAPSAENLELTRVLPEAAQNIAIHTMSMLTSLGKDHSAIYNYVHIQDKRSICNVCVHFQRKETALRPHLLLQSVLQCICS